MARPMKQCKAMVWLSILLAATLLAGDETEETQRVASGSIAVVVSMPSVVFEGGPCFVALEISNHGPVVALPSPAELQQLSLAEKTILVQNDALTGYAIPVYGILSQQDPPLSIEVYDAIQQERELSVAPDILAFYVTNWNAISTESAPVNRDKFRRPRLTVASGERRLLFVDLGPWLRPLRPGTYTLIIAVHEDWKTTGWKSQAVQFDIVRLDAGVRAVLRDLVPSSKSRDAKLELPRSTDWLEYDLNLERLQGELPKDIFDQIAPYLFMNGAAGTGIVALAPIELLESFPPHLQPLADVLRYEVLRAAGDQAAATLHRVNILSRQPAVEWQFDRVDSDNGLISEAVSLARHREFKQSIPTPN